MDGLSTNGALIFSGVGVLDVEGTFIFEAAVGEGWAVDPADVPQAVIKERRKRKDNNCFIVLHS